MGENIPDEKVKNHKKIPTNVTTITIKQKLPGNTYRLLHVKSLISFLFTSFQYHTAHSLEDSLVRDIVLKTRE